MPRPPRPGLTSQPSEGSDAISIVKNSTTQPFIGTSNVNTAPTGVAVDAESGAILANPSTAHAEEGEDGNNASNDDERSSLLGKPRKLVSVRPSCLHKMSGRLGQYRRYFCIAAMQSLRFANPQPMWWTACLTIACSASLDPQTVSTEQNSVLTFAMLSSFIRL